MKQVPLSEMKDDLSRYLRMATTEDIVITRRGVPAGILIGIEDPEDLWEDLLLNTPEFKARIAQARANLRSGNYKTLAEIKAKYAVKGTKPKDVKKTAPSTRKRKAGHQTAPAK